MNIRSLYSPARDRAMGISDRMPRVKIEYDCRGQRKTKPFTDPYQARQFYMAKLREGKNPAVRKWV